MEDKTKKTKLSEMSIADLIAVRRALKVTDEIVYEYQILLVEEELSERLDHIDFNP